MKARSIIKRNLNNLPLLSGEIELVDNQIVLKRGDRIFRKNAITNKWIFYGIVSFLSGKTIEQIIDQYGIKFRFVRSS